MRIAKPLLVSLAFALLAGCPCAPPDLTASIPEEGQYDVTIHRDLFGVPHIYGKTDPDVAYGLGFAQCEDDFYTVQEMLLSVRGRLATHQRFGGVGNDLIVRAFKVQETVDTQYETEVRPEVRALCEAYADGVNHYAALHPEEIYAGGVFPTSGKDVIAGFTLRMPFFYLLHRHIRGVFDPNQPIRQQTAQADEAIVGSEDRGSNTFAVAPSRSADGHTRLAVNSHQPWTGPVAWYEARLKSEEGWDIIGGTFPGAPVILHGHNRNLGWAHTVNVPDLCDIYELTLNPDNPDQYRFDGEWRNFEKEEVTLRVRLWGPITIGVTRELLWSVHGPAVISDEGAFAVRFVGYGEVNQLGQFYAMNRATNFDEFRSAMAMQGFFSMNTGYADKEGNIWYLYNAKFPVRNPGYDWSGIVPGDTSETLWTEYYPFEKLPQVLNPASGFIQNCNCSPWKTTTGPGNPDPADFPEWLGIPDEMTNRGWRALELFGNDESITGAEFHEYKFDQRYSRQSLVGDLWEQAAALPPFDDPLLNEAIEVIRN
jgi:acyl-homoserine-lactone acylase